jgi:ubiquinone/menaquinone biosynthesis C-methylase UbiE
MKFISHESAKPSHYDNQAQFYDVLNEQNSKHINQLLAKILRKYKVKTVLDLTCGTGSQVFWLNDQGFEVTGADINAKMLTIAKKKAKENSLNIKLLKGDMRHISVGKFCAVITIFNAIGHLTKKDFQIALANINGNLTDGGLYIFDIFNLNYLLHKDNISKLTIDWLNNADNCYIREIQYSTIDQQGILSSFTTAINQKARAKPNIIHSSQTLQVYTLQQLKDMLKRNGFKVIYYSSADGSRFSQHKTERLFIVAKKQSV